MKKDRPAHLQEFAERVKALIAPYGSRAKAAKELGIPDNTLRRACEGKNEPQAPLLMALSTKLNVSMSYLLGLTDDPAVQTTDGERGGLEFQLLPSLDASVAAGVGAINHHVAVEKRLAFPDWMLKKLAPAGGRFSFLRAKGDSMAPLFEDGALLLVNEAAKKIPKARAKDGLPSDIFVFLDEGVLRVKRLREIAPGEILLTSENRDYDVEIARGTRLDRFEVLGRVVWWDSRL